MNNMPTEKLQRYTGYLSAEQITLGMNMASQNARELLREAELLLDNGHYARAASIATLSIEESGKQTALRALALARTTQEQKTCWRDFRSHTNKNAMWILPDLIKRGARKLDDFKPLFSEDATHSQILDQVKQIGFYADCFGDAHWSEPSKVLSDDLARSIIESARLFLSPREVTTEEIELWIEHVGPVWKRGLPMMKQGLLSWNQAMKQRGLMETSMFDFVDLASFP